MAAFVVTPLTAALTPASSVNTSRRFQCPRTANVNLRDARALDAELRRFSEKVFADANVLPRLSDLSREQRGDLRYAIVQYHGGFRAFRTVSTQRPRRRRSTNSTNKTNSKSENTAATDETGMEFRELADQIREFIEEHIVPLDKDHADLSRRYFPTHAAFRLSGRSDLTRQIQKHGGSRAVALRMGLHLHYHAATDYAGEPARFRMELRRFIAPGTRFDPTSVRMPTNAELHRAGRLDLIAGIRVHGGAAAVANSLNVKMARGPRPAEPKAPRTPPTVLDESFFALEVSDEEALRHNATNALRPAHEERGYSGGALLPRDGGRRRAHYHYQNFDTVKRELHGFIFDDGTPGCMPTQSELIKAGRRDLVRAMQIHGGQKMVARKMGLARKSAGRKQTDLVT